MFPLIARSIVEPLFVVACMVVEVGFGEGLGLGEVTVNVVWLSDAM